MEGDMMEWFFATLRQNAEIAFFLALGGEGDNEFGEGFSRQVRSRSIRKYHARQFFALHAQAACHAS
jgi:hypothetical protein